MCDAGETRVVTVSNFESVVENVYENQDRQIKSLSDMQFMKSVLLISFDL